MKYSVQNIPMIGPKGWFELNLLNFFIVASPIKNSVKTTET